MLKVAIVAIALAINTWLFLVVAAILLYMGGKNEGDETTGESGQSGLGSPRQSVGRVRRMRRRWR